MRRWLAFIFLISFICSCNSKKDYVKLFQNPLLYTDMVHELNTVVMGNNFSPIVASRNYLYASIAGYEVVAAGYPKRFQSLGGQLHGLGKMPELPKGQTINVELASMLAYCRLGESVTFPEGSMKLYVDSIKQMALDHGMPDDIYKNTLAFADTIGSAILNWSKHDNYAKTRGAPEYNVNDSPGRWVPTPPAYALAMEPHWNTIRTLVIDSPRQFIPPPPYPFNVTDSSSLYYQQVKLSQHTVDSLTTEQTWIADFWDDNPFKLNVSGHLMFGTKKFSPGGHWMGIVGIAAKQSKSDFPTTAYAYAKTAVALFDAFIECWNIKYTYNTLRPETAINKYFDPNWRPHLQTPPFPEYTCGHCTISASCGEALTSVFGDHFKYTDTTELEFGIDRRTYNSFRDAANENIMARFYGGIHYYYCCVRSNKMGRSVGDLVADRLKMKR